LARLIGGMLYNVHPNDLFSFATMTLILGIVSLLACYIPARRAMHIDPMVALSTNKIVRVPDSDPSGR
jgi:ABC-type lipoprotein release transport system permease subunit